MAYLSMGECPICGEDEFDHPEPTRIEGDYYYLPYTCTACGFMGEEVYELTYVETRVRD